MWQQGEDNNSTRFQHALSELQESQLSQESWELLCTRIANQLSAIEVTAFDDTLRLYFTTTEVTETNYSRLAAINQPVLKIIARNKGRNTAKATEDEADNLSPEIHVCIGARVMLTSNLWTEIGLVNGSMGTVCDITWNQDRDPSTLPSIILIRFDGYNGPDFPSCGPGIIPVFPITH
jgi:hypothetical protein